MLKPNRAKNASYSVMNTIRVRSYIVIEIFIKKDGTCNENDGYTFFEVYNLHLWMPSFGNILFKDNTDILT